jgi:hypothetical protein
MVSLVWIAILISFAVGAAVRGLPRHPATVLAGAWGVAGLLATLLLVGRHGAGASLEQFGFTALGALGAFFAGSALLGLIRDWRAAALRMTHGR